MYYIYIYIYMIQFPAGAVEVGHLAPDELAAHALLDFKSSIIEYAPGGRIYPQARRPNMGA